MYRFSYSCATSPETLEQSGFIQRPASKTVLPTPRLREAHQVVLDVVTAITGKMNHRPLKIVDNNSPNQPTGKRSRHILASIEYNLRPIASVTKTFSGPSEAQTDWLMNQYAQETGSHAPAYLPLNAED